MNGATARPAAAHGANGIDLERVRADFPILHRPVRGKRLAFLDSAASAQKPVQVIDAVRRCYETEYANIHRGVYYLSERATANFEAARETVRGFLNAAETAEIVFTRSGTEAINLVAASWGGANIRAGDEIVVPVLEHHSNIVPWQLLAQRAGATLRAVPVDDSGALDMAAFGALLGPKTRLVAITHTSNALGIVPPVAEIIRMAHAAGAVVLVDGCQAAVHGAIDVQALDADFYVITGHKLYGPTGTGVLYGKRALLDAMPPWQGGGEMIARVSFEGSTWAGVPHRFEAGTPNIAGIIGLAAALDWMDGLGLDNIAAHEHALLDEATAAVRDLGGIRIYGTATGKAPILSFDVVGVHPHDVGTVLDETGVAVRAGHHCAQPLMDRFGLSGTVRASFAAYNGPDDVAQLVAGLRRVRELFG